MNERVGEPLIVCRDLTHCYVRGDDRLTVLDHLDITVNKGDFVAIMGPSGSGKTTLLNLIGGLDRPSGGSIRVHGLELSRLSRASLAEWRASTVGFVFQFYNLLPTLTALGNVELPLLLTTTTAPSGTTRGTPRSGFRIRPFGRS